MGDPLWLIIGGNYLPFPSPPPAPCPLVTFIPRRHRGRCRLSHRSARWFGPGAVLSTAVPSAAAFRAVALGSRGRLLHLFSTVEKSCPSHWFPVVNLHPVPRPECGAFCPCCPVGAQFPGSCGPGVQRAHGFTSLAASFCSLSGSQRLA